MAATRPIAVANNASAMPGATTASEVFCDAAIDWKLVMIPATVPNSPINGPAEPTVASTKSRRSICSTSRAMATSITFSMRICNPAKERTWPSRLRFHSRIAATNSAPVECSGCVASDLYRSSSDWPDQNASSKWSPARRSRANNSVLSMAIFHTQTEQTSSPTITDSTIQWACQNRWNSERLEDVSGATDEEMSAGFMSVPWSVPSGDPGRTAPRTGTKTDKPDRSRRPKIGLKGSSEAGRYAHADRHPNYHDDPAGPSPARRNQSRNVSKLGRDTGHFRLRSPVVLNAPLTAWPPRGQWQPLEQQWAFGLGAFDYTMPQHPIAVSKRTKFIMRL